VFAAHLMITGESAVLFVGEGKVAPALREKLAADGIVLAPYGEAAAALAALPSRSHVLLDPRRITLAFRQAVPETVRVIEAINPSTMAKSRKSEAEIAFVRQAMEEDGAALAEFFAWFEAALGREPITELTIDERITGRAAAASRVRLPELSDHRRLQRQRRAAALPRHRRSARADRRAGEIRRRAAADRLRRPVSVRHHRHHARRPGGRHHARAARGLHARAQGHDFAVAGDLPARHALAVARRAGAHADLGRRDRLRPRHRARGRLLPQRARGPHGITPHLAPDPHTALEPGMITSNEPGIYRPGRWGVRIENLVLTVPAEKTEFGEFLRFETLTLCPIDTPLHRARPADRRRDRLAERLPRRGGEPRRAAGQRRGARVARAAHAADLRVAAGVPPGGRRWTDSRRFCRGDAVHDARADAGQVPVSPGLSAVAGANRSCTATSWSSVVATTHRRADSTMWRLWSLNGPIEAADFQSTGPIRLVLPDGVPTSRQ